MKIVKLSIENIKRVIAAEITPDGNIVEITGKNGSGKTSVLDSIMWALAGTKDMQKQPIRRGASEGIVEIDLGDLKVTRKFSQTGSTLHVEKADGTRVEKPQSVLDRLFSKVAFDPLAFSRMKPKEQFEELRKLVKIDVDLVRLDELNASDYSKRADFNRDIRSLKASSDSLTFPSTLPDEKIDISELSKQVEKGAQHNADITTDKVNRQSIEANIKNLRDKAVLNGSRKDELAHELKAEIAKLTEKYEKMIAFQVEERESRNKVADSLENEMKSKPPIADPIDIIQIRKQIDDAVLTNSMIDKRIMKAKILEDLKQAEAQAHQLSEAMLAREDAKRAAIAAAKMPVAGLGLGKDEVLLNEIPFEQASHAEQLRASCAIAMAMNPTLRVLRICDGSLLDSDSMKILGDLCTENDFQAWIEVVDDTGNVGIVMEDGHIKQREAWPAGSQQDIPDHLYTE